MGIKENKDLVTRYTRLIELGAIDAAFELVAEDCKFWHPVAGLNGKAQVQGVLKAFVPATRARFQIEALTAEADRVAVEMEVDAAAPTGANYHNRYLILYVVRDGKIVSSRHYGDSMPTREAFLPFL